MFLRLITIPSIAAFFLLPYSATYAQSNVVGYGLLDVGYLGSNSTQRISDKSITKTNTNVFSDGNEANNRLGVKGQEDLGSGLMTFFLIETGYSINSSSQTFDNRSSFLGMRSVGFGKFAIGRQYTPLYDSVYATDAGQLNNFAGDVIQGSNLMGNYAGNSTQQAFTFRQSNALTVSTDVIDGFSMSGMFVLNNSNQTQTYVSSSNQNGGINNNDGWGVNAAYSFERLYLNMAYQLFNTTITNGGQTAYSGPTFYGSKLSDKQSYLAATYDFDDFKLFLQWAQRKIMQNYQNSYTKLSPGGQELGRFAQQIGFRGFWTPVIESWASIGSGQYKGALTTTSLSPSINFMGWQLGVNYYLSRTTNLYAVFGQELSSSQTINAIGSGNSGSSYGAGLKIIF